MKSFIKSSFFLILLMAIFNMGVSDAYAEEAEASKTHNIENAKAAILQCSTSSVTNAAMLFSSSMATNLMDECQLGVIVLENGTVILIFPDCTIVIDNGDGDPVVVEA